MVLDTQGNVLPANPEAEEWLQMGAFDQYKKANQKTYQQIIYEMCRLDYRHQKPILHLTPSESAWGAAFLKEQGHDTTRKLIGLNLGGGGRWKHKRWTEAHLRSFSTMVINDERLQLLIIGGPWERELCQRLLEHVGHKALFSETGRTLRETASLVALCQTLVTGDTLVLHMATALDTPVIALFGPTSASEIELYGKGVGLSPDIACACCYLADCSVHTTCMSLITPREVFLKLQQTTEQSQKGGPTQ